MKTRFQFSLRHLLIVVTVTCVVLGFLRAWMLPCHLDHGSRQDSSRVCATKGGIWRIQWGEREGKLRYVAFVRDGTSEPKEIVCVEGSQTRLSRGLGPAGEEESLPASANVFELIDGRFRQQWVELSVDQANRFCNSPQTEYTIDALMAELKQKPTPRPSPIRPLREKPRCPRC